MPDPLAVASAFAAIAALAFGGWLASLARRDTSIVDALWALFFLAAVLVYAALVHATPRTFLVIGLVAAWALRLSGHIAWRSRGQPEDRRYQAIRARNEPGYAWKSLYLVFGLQAVLAFVIAAPLFATLAGSRSLSALDVAGAALWIGGIAFETTADWQLARFRAVSANRGRVLDTGLWRYSRHPNYFGEALVWWGAYLVAVAAGGAWTVYAPLLMTYLLLRVSGVTLLEHDIHERRPAYRDYVQRTPAFLPWLPREPLPSSSREGC